MSCCATSILRKHTSNLGGNIAQYTCIYNTHMLSAILIYPCCNVINLCLGLLPATSGTAPSELDPYSLGQVGKLKILSSLPNERCH